MIDAPTELPLSTKRDKFLTVSLLIFIFIFCITFFMIFTIYKPIYKITINNETVGYINNQIEFEEVFNVLSKNIQATYENAKVHLKEEPQFEKIYRRSIDSNVNIYSAVREKIEVEYTIYSVKLGEETVEFSTSIEANNYIDELSKIKLLEKPELITTIKTEAPQNLTGIALRDRYNNIVSRYRAPTPPKNFKPAEGYYSSYFGNRSNPFNGKAEFHSGLDIAGSYGSSIKAWRTGKVISVGWDGGYGNAIVIQHNNGYQTRYAHLSKFNISIGEEVEIGQKIAEMGSTGYSTGPHLHIEILLNGKFLDPLPYMQ